QDVEAIVVDWINELIALGFGADDPLFPATKIALDGGRHFAAAGLGRRHWRDAGPIRRIFKEAFARAGLPHYVPHSVRHTLAIHSEKMELTPEQWKAYSQNFGHTSPMTTFNSYGPVAPHRQAEIMSELATARVPDSTPDLKLTDEQVRLVLSEIAKTLSV